MITQLKIYESLKTSKEKYNDLISKKLSYGTFDVLAAMDPSSTYKYLDMICKYVLDGIPIDDVSDYIHLFDTLSNKGLLKNKDIYTYKNFDDLKKISEINTTSKNDLKREVRKQTNVLIDNDDMLVIEPLTHSASCKYGFGTKWCISMKDDAFFYYALKKQGSKLFFIIVKNKELSASLFDKYKKDISQEYSVGSSSGSPDDPNSFDKIVVLSSAESNTLQFWVNTNRDLNVNKKDFLKTLNIDKNIFKNKNKKGSVMDILEKNTFITKFKAFENTGKFVNVDYKIITKDLKDNPNLLVTDFKIIKSESKKLTIKGKGYIKESLSGYGNKNKKVWVEFDDFKDDKTRIVWNKHFENGSKRIKVVL